MSGRTSITMDVQQRLAAALCFCIHFKATDVIIFSNLFVFTIGRTLHHGLELHCQGVHFILGKQIKATAQCSKRKNYFSHGRNFVVFKIRNSLKIGFLSNNHGRKFF